MVSLRLVDARIDCIDLSRSEEPLSCGKSFKTNIPVKDLSIRYVRQVVNDRPTFLGIDQPFLIRVLRETPGTSGKWLVDLLSIRCLQKRVGFISRRPPEWGEGRVGLGGGGICRNGCGSKNQNSKMGCPGKWKHGPTPAVCPSC